MLDTAPPESVPGHESFLPSAARTGHEGRRPHVDNSIQESNLGLNAADRLAQIGDFRSNRCGDCLRLRFSEND